MYEKRMLPTWALLLVTLGIVFAIFLGGPLLTVAALNHFWGCSFDYNTTLLTASLVLGVNMILVIIVNSSSSRR